MRYYDYYEYCLGMEAMQDLAPEDNERILDLGCGDGKLSEIIEIEGATVLGIDNNADRVKAAQERGIDAHVVDAQSMQFDCEFDAVFAHYSLHCILRQQDVIPRVFNALKPGGRFVAVMAGEGNAICIRRAIAEMLAERDINFFERDPSIYPTSDEQRKLLREAGFNVIKCNLRKGSSPMSLTDVKDWFATHWRFDEILFDLSDSDRDEVINNIVERLSPKFCNADGAWMIEGAQINFVAIKP